MSASEIVVHVPVFVQEEVDSVLLPERGAWDRPLRLGLVDNGKPKAREILLLLADELGAIAPVAEVVLLSKDSAAAPISVEEAGTLAGKVDIAITGIGDCGACSACSLQDALLLESQGVPSTVLITDVFIDHVERFAKVLGAPGYPHLIVPHPVATKPEERLRELARGVAETARTYVSSSVPALA